MCASLTPQSFKAYHCAKCIFFCRYAMPSKCCETRHANWRAHGNSWVCHAHYASIFGFVWCALLPRNKKKLEINTHHLRGNAIPAGPLSDFD